MGRFKLDINALHRNLEEGRRILEEAAAEEAKLTPEERAQQQELNELHDLCVAWYQDAFPSRMLYYSPEQVWQARVALENFLMQCVANGDEK